MTTTREKYCWKVEKDGHFSLWQGDLPILCAYARARTIDNALIETRNAQLVSETVMGERLTLLYEATNGLMMREELRCEGDVAYARCVLLAKDGSEVETNDLVPLVMGGLDKSSPYLWRGLESRILQVPYDNDMWPRSEAVALRPGRWSADYTVLLNEQTREGVMIGAVEFDVWKNGVACSGFDCRTLEARSGCEVTGDNTHDLLPHGTLVGKEVASSEFVVMYGQDWRDLLERYGDIVDARTPRREWPGEAPWGYNTFAAFALKVTRDRYQRGGAFVRDELMTRGFGSDGTTFMNLDDGWRDIDREEMLAVKDEHLAGGQHVGIYDAPFAYWGKDLDAQIPYLDEPHTFREIMVKDPDGNPLALDTAYAFDVTHPVWQEWTRRKAQFYFDWGFDFAKFDFMSHAGLEGCHFDPTVRTGRQALKIGYDFLADVYDERRIGHPFYISISISPLLPIGSFNTRRISCDSFGLPEDIEYVLNAQTYGWWTCGRLYQHNDADHVVLWQSFDMGRPSTLDEARARYTTAAVAGSTMLLSDDYKLEEARERAIAVTTNERVNHVARSGVAFRPMDAAGVTASHAYTGVVDGVVHVALFSWSGEPERVTCPLGRLDVPAGTYEDLWTGARVSTEDGALSWNFADTGAVLLKFVG